MPIRSRGQGQWFRQLIEGTAEPITIVSVSSGRFIDINSAFHRKTGFGAGEIIGETPFDVGFLADRVAYASLLGNYLGETATEFEFRTKAGEARLAQPAGIAIRVADQPCLMIIWRDITERRQFENDMTRARDLALEAARLKTEFLANVSHEIRTPLNGIIGMSQLLLDTELTLEQLEFAETIAMSSDVLLKLVNDILDFSKLSNQKLSLEELDIDLREVVKNAVDSVAVLAAGKSLKMSTSVDAALPNRVCGDPYRLRQVLTNLIANAVKFTDSGEVAVVVAPQEIGEKHAIIRFEVRDTGIGISASDQNRLFQPFVQADGSMTRKYGGTGLGLAICARLVELMKGTIGVHSAPGHGSTFYFTAQFGNARAADSDKHDLGAPVESAPDGSDPASTPSASVAYAQSAPARTRILIVEDNNVSLLVVRQQLKKLGYTNFESAANGREALEVLARADYDIVLIDCNMPVMDGFETTMLLRRSEEGKRHTRVIALTARALAQDREKCLAAGMDDYISKPVRLEMLSAALERWRSPTSCVVPPSAENHRQS